MSEQIDVSYELKGAVALLTLQRPQTLNAMTRSLMQGLCAAVHRAEADPAVRALVLTGAGRGFCSGQDLRDRPPAGTDLEVALMEAYYPAIAALRECRVPVVAAVNGVAAGAGFSLAMAGDFLFAGASARFIQSFGRIGLVPDLGSTYLLPRAIGRARALRLMLTGETLSAADALSWGLATECVPDAELLDRALTWAGQLAQGPTLAFSETRRLLDAAEGQDFAAQFRAELAAQNRMRASADATEGVQAFLEKRPAVFSGR